jgi:multicomponent Na+:H+ antiporter subunit C
MNFIDFISAHYDYFMIVLLMAIGLYAMLVKRNLVKKLGGMSIFQTGIFLFYIEGARKLGGTVPIIDESLGAQADLYINPIPHVLILTGIVVGISLTGVALAFLIKIYRSFGSLNDKVIMERMKDTND